MNKSISLVIILFLLLLGCKAKKAASNSVVDEVKSEGLMPSDEAKAFIIGDIDNVGKADLMFSMKEIELKGNKLEIAVQYGGGCVRPHVFELVSDGVIDSKGNMDFFLLHKTHNDMCKALIMETLVYDFQPLFNLKSEKLKSFKVNDMRKMDFE